MKSLQTGEILIFEVRHAGMDMTQFIILGRRLGYYRQLSDLENELTHQFVEKQVRKIGRTDPDSFEEIFHNLRRQVI